MRQAVSLYLATQTGQWWSIDGATADDEHKSGEFPEFDPDAIAGYEELLSRSDRSWRDFFDASHIDPLVIDYEDLAADYAKTIQSVVDWLGIPAAERIKIPPPRLRRQSNALSEDCVARYTAFKREHVDSLGRPGADLSESALFNPVEPFAVIPDLWREWVAQARLLGYTSDAIAAVLVRNGYSRHAAQTEAQKAASDPYLRACARSRHCVTKAAALLAARGDLRRLDSRATVIERRIDRGFHSRRH